MSNNNFASTLGNINIQEAYDKAVDTRMQKVTQRANSAIQSFADLIAEINKLQNESKGTTVKKEVEVIANDMNNSTVMFTRMFTAQLETLHGIVRPTEEAETTKV